MRQSIQPVGPGKVPLPRANSAARCQSLESRLFLSAGDADLSFSDDGLAVLGFPGSAFVINDVGIQSDGKTVLAGTKGNNMALARLNVDGSLDTTFGNGGLFESDKRAEVTDIVIQQDDKILMAFGHAQSFENLAVGRLFATGSGFDIGFGNFGIASIPGQWTVDSVNDLAVQHDGKIIAAGGRSSGGTDFAIARYTTNGQPDPDFDSDGVVIAGFGAEEQALAVAIDYNGTPVTNLLYGTIVAVGDKRSGSSDPSTRFTICRLNSDGSFDNSFDGDGKLTSPDLSPDPEEGATGVVIQPGGKIVVTGNAATSPTTLTSDDLLLARYLSSGMLDASFGSSGTGVVQTDIGGLERANEATTGYVGDILVAGSRNGSALVVAYTRDGRLDSRFNGTGQLINFAMGGPVGIATTGNTIAPIRRVVIAGSGRVGRYIDVGSVVAIGSFDPESSEPGSDVASITVGRTERLDTAERVYINVGGTATPPYRLNADYTVSGMTLVNPFTGPSYIDIPPGQTIATATITPVDDTRTEGDETIVFSISSGLAYDIGTPPSTTLAIRDNEVTGGPVVSSAQFVYDSGPPQRVTFRFNQSVVTSIGAGDFAVAGPSGAVPFSFAYDDISNTATLSFSSTLPDGNYTATAIASGISNSGGTPMASDYPLPFFFLNGDFNHDRIVDVTDLGILATNWQASGKTFSAGDGNYDGHVDVTDLGILATNWQKQVPAPAPTAAMPPLIGSTLRTDNTSARGWLIRDVLA